MPINQPGTQIKLTNVSVVRQKKGGKRFEVSLVRGDMDPRLCEMPLEQSVGRQTLGISERALPENLIKDARDIPRPPKADDIDCLLSEQSVRVPLRRVSLTSHAAKSNAVKD